MRRLTVVVATLAVGALGTGAWVLWRPAPEPGAAPEAPLELAPGLSQPAPSNVPAEIMESAIPVEPEPPAMGTPARRVYFEAMVAGDQRALAAVRKALSAARSGPGAADETHLGKLAAMEKAYVERLERHGLNLRATQ